MTDNASTGPVLTNFTGNELLESQTAPTGVSQTLLVLLGIPPLVVFVLAVLRGQKGLALVAGSFRSASRKCQAQIEAATRPAEVGAAVRTFLARRLGLRSSADAAAIVGRLRSTGYRNLAVRSERLFAQCDADGSVSFSRPSHAGRIENMKRCKRSASLESESRASATAGAARDSPPVAGSQRRHSSHWRLDRSSPRPDRAWRPRPQPRHFHPHSSRPCSARRTSVTSLGSTRWPTIRPKRSRPSPTPPRSISWSSIPA